MNDQENKYIIVLSERHESYDLFNDLQGLDNVEFVVTRRKKIDSKYLKAARKIHLSGVIANHVRIPFKKIWYSDVELSLSDQCNNYIIILDMALSAIKPSHINTLKTEKNNTKLILLCINSVKTDVIRQLKHEIKTIQWDAIYSYDKNDVGKYRFTDEIHCYYSFPQIITYNKEISRGPSDAYFVGTLKTSRKREILGLYEKLKKEGLNLEFHLMKTGKERIENYPFEDEIDYFTPDRGLIPYSEILGSIQHTNTIIDIVQEGQSGPSLRYYEAVCFNKKLLTNNQSVKDLKYYDSRFMEVFENINEIDIDWVKREEEVDYHYSGDFSPLNLLKLIRN